MMLRLKMLLLPMRLLISSRKLSVISPPIWLKEMSTTMLSTKHFSSFTCTCIVSTTAGVEQATILQTDSCKVGECLKV